MTRNGNRRLSLADLNPKFVERNRAEIERQLAAPASRTIAIEPAPEIEAQPKERRIRQSHTKLNKLETDYFDVLRMKYGANGVSAQSVRLRLSNGSWYKPDFFIPTEKLFIETKGPRAFRGGFENLKVAAAAHPWAKFRLVWRVGSEWKFQEVLP